MFLRVVEPFDKVLIALHRTAVHPDKLPGVLHGLRFLVEKELVSAETDRLYISLHFTLHTTHYTDYNAQYTILY